MKYIMALDQGTTSCRCIIFDHRGRIVAQSQEEFAQYFPAPGWVEQDAVEIWNCQLRTMKMAMMQLGITTRDIVGVGVTNQRETTVVWEKNTGKPIYHAIVWQCRRTAGVIDDLIREGYKDYIQKKTGLIPDAYFSGSKIQWILDNVEGARICAERGELLFGTMETWLIWNLTGGKTYVTDYTNASRTMLFNIHNLCWDEDLLSLFRIPKCMLPDVMPSSHIYGKITTELVGGAIPIGGAIGDQQAALFGQCCFQPGEIKITYGTGCFLLMNTGTSAIHSPNGLLTTIAVGLEGNVEYALEGSIFIGGAVVQWLRDKLKMIDESRDSEYFASKVFGDSGVYLVPAFTGLAAPYWNQYARGTITGITRGFTRAQLIRATLESIAYQTYDICEAMSRDAGMPITRLKVDGGASANDFLMRFQSDILGAQVVRPECIETTAMGAAYLAGLAVGFWKSLDEVKEIWQTGRIFSPEMEEEERIKLLSGWHKAVKLAINWTKE